MFTLTSSINTPTLFNYILSTSLFYVTSTLFAFSFSFDSVISIFVNKLIIDSTAQKTRLSSALSANVEIELKRTLNYYAKLRSTKNFSMNLLIDLIALLNCDSIVVKVALTLLVKTFFTNFHESKLYKKAIIDAQHKMN